MLTHHSAVWVAVETATRQVELELVPTVEIPTAWSEKARWPPCLKRWPSRQRAECIKVSGSRGAQFARAEALTAYPPAASLPASQLWKGKMRFHSISGAPGGGPAERSGP